MLVAVMLIRPVRVAVLHRGMFVLMAVLSLLTGMLMAVMLVGDMGMSVDHPAMTMSMSMLLGSQHAYS